MDLDSRLAAYTLTEEIGRGSYGTVHLARLKNDRHKVRNEAGHVCVCV